MARERPSIFEQYNIDSPIASEFRRLVMKIRKNGSDKENKTILVTSSMLSEGKSTTCSLVGITAALHEGLRTLIIDTDLRRPSIHKFFEIPRYPGLAEILSEGFSGKDAIVKTELDKLDIIPAGRNHESPASLFDAEAISYLTDEMKFYYDLILLDCAPLLPVSDPLMLASKVDGILMVVRAGETNRDVTVRAVEILGDKKEKVLGVVLNNVDNSLPFYYDYSYYGYQYQGTGEQKGSSSDTGKASEAGPPKSKNKVKRRKDGRGESESASLLDARKIDE